MKIILPVCVVLCGLLQSAWAYSLGGPIGNGGDSWQQPVIGYGLPGDVVAPKNLGEEYRRNTPGMYYAFDANFLEFFGSNGVAAVDGAYAILNNLTNVSSYSAGLSEFPTESRHVNYQAQALGLYDLKSSTLGLMIEQLGLADPVRYNWTLHDRLHVGNVACPAGMEYIVVQRNFDIVSSPLNQLQYSPYINNTLYSYQILEACTGPDPLALASPFSVDPLADIDSPVASFAIGYGDYYTGLTRDDVAGLRYLLQSNNINWETTAPGATATVISTNSTSQIPFPANTNSPSGFGTFSLGALVSASTTNSPAALQLLFPGLIVATSSNYLTVVATPNIISYYTNYPGETIGTPPHLVVITNGYTYSPLTMYVTTFANVVTNHYYGSNTTATLQTITVGPLTGAPIGSPSVTNVSNKQIILTNVPSGDYFLLSPDLCPVNLLGILYTNVQSVTNVITAAATNVVTSSNTTTLAYSQSIVTKFTNYVYTATPVNCNQSTNSTGLYGGIENIKFIKSSFDSLLGQFFQPVTNNYTMVAVTNSQPYLQYLQRVVTAPDFLISAADLATSPSDNRIGASLADRTPPNFITANVLPRLAGPGTIAPTTTLTFDKVGPVYFNSSGDVMDGTPYFNETPGGDNSDLFYITYFVWASFDGTTNAPVVYPDGTSIDNLGNMVLVQVSPPPPLLPNGTKGMDYPATVFTATGGSFSTPFTWSATGLPAGLGVSSDGTLAGTPTQSGTFDFILQLTDSLGRSVQWNYTITIQ